MIPRRLLIIGDSHTAAPRIALRETRARWPDFDHDVFAMPGGSLRALDLRDGVFLPASPEARKEMRFYNDVTALPLRSYDGFIVFGGLQFSSSASYLSRHRTSDLAAAPGRPRALMSGGFLDAVLMRRVSHSVGVHVAKALEELDQGPVLFMSAALPSDAVLGSAEAKWQDYRDLARRGDGPAYHQRFLTQLDRALGPGIRRLSQPAATISGEVFTAAEWMRGSFRMNPRRDVAHGEEDMIHTNPSYGALQIDAAMEAFAAL